ncbi:glycosyltransferase family 2 protein [Pseudomonas gingeri]|uniref:glycosyltransferase family 2 protein n=1 Tax=Pseudomonas gingeri TaxID=117681 RepID=UPI00210A1967|nr:glycosyltransferase family 2 protein [Pseudomonas gingeri]
MVTVGMPVYNGGDFFEKALLSVLNQSHRDIVVVISDNCSSDVTSSICERYKALDERIVYFKQSSNIGAERNFDFVLQQAKTKYFMFAASDDLISEDYIRDNLEFLEHHGDYVASTCPVRFSTGESDSAIVGDQTVSAEDTYERALSMLNYRCSNGRFYSLYRRAAIAGWTFEGRSFIGADLLFVFFVLLQGKMNRLSRGYIELGREGLSTKPEFYSRYGNSLRSYIAPFREYTGEVMALLEHASVFIRLRALKFFVVLNFRTALIRILHTLKIYGFSAYLKKRLFG